MNKYRIPQEFLPYIGVQDDDALRCSECSGYTACAAIIGIVGRFCSCPFDVKHP